ncbi:unnamed protein product, partial [Ixodes hexagonus]
MLRPVFEKPGKAKQSRSFDESECLHNQSNDRDLGLPHKPCLGGKKEFLNEEWIIEDSLRNPEHTNVVYNPNVSLSIHQQRERLPVFKSRTDILYLLEKHQVLIVTGETGSGKSTQIPQYLMEAGWAQRGQVIGITQPRRVAAISLAKRVAEEKGCLAGQEVGYCVRFDDCFDKLD